MGNKHTLEDDLITFKLTSKQMLRSAKKCETNMAGQKLKLKKAIEQKNPDSAKIYAQNVIREKNQSLQFLRLASRIDAVASRLETAIRMQDVNKAMGQTVQGMTNAMKTMNVEQISRTMSEFEKQFENMDVMSGYMEGAMESTTCMTTPADEVNQLIQMVGDEYKLETGDLLDSAGTVGKHLPAVSAEAKEDRTLEQRLADLRNN